MCTIRNKPFQDLLSFVELVIPRQLNGKISNGFITRENDHFSLPSHKLFSLTH